MSASTRWLAVVAGVIALAVVAGVIVSLTAGDEKAYPPGSPERAVQDYLHAVADRDVTLATSFLSDELVARCSTVSRDVIANRSSSGLRASLERVTTRGETAEVHVRITETYGDGPFGSNESSQTVVFTLLRSGDEWRITEQPWPLYCPTVPVLTK